VQGWRSLIQRLLAWFQSEYDEHLKSWEEDSPRDFLDLYIGEHKKANKEQNDTSSFYGEMGSANFLLTMYDLFLAGSETTSTTLTW
jgi:cytochrome P450